MNQEKTRVGFTQFGMCACVGRDQNSVISFVNGYIFLFMLKTL